MSRNKVILSALLLAGIGQANRKREMFPANNESIECRPPNGTKEYFFNELGDFATQGTPPMRRDETVFWCYAINDKNAIRKFKAWKKKK